MRKAMMILILAAMMSGCENNAKEEKPVKSSATTTTAATTTKATSSTAATTTKAVQTTPSVTTQNRYTTTAEASKTAVSSVSVKSEITTAKSMTTQNRQTYVVYETEYAEFEQPEQTTQSSQITITTTTAATTTTSATHPTVEWSENMAVWRKLCEGRQLTESEQNVIRSEIQDYALTTFNGRQDIHVSFGTDEFDISFEQPLELAVRNEMVGMENAHMDAYCDPNRKGMIDYASSEEEVYMIVSDTRSQCLHIIDYGLFNRYEIFTINIYSFQGSFEPFSFSSFFHRSLDTTF